MDAEDLAYRRRIEDLMMMRSVAVGSRTQSLQNPMLWIHKHLDAHFSWAESAVPLFPIQESRKFCRSVIMESVKLFVEVQRLENRLEVRDAQLEDAQAELAKLKTKKRWTWPWAR